MAKTPSSRPRPLILRSLTTPAHAHQKTHPGVAAGRVFH
ncbi:conserved hypothetical protein [Lacticaseibacillus rhamnosus ATCC 8530]|nr:conserved hypothetical protein [Lacticaseibacillus rhamnosus ATCC 8530]